MNSANLNFSSRQFISNIEKEELPPNEMIEIDMAYTLYQDETLNNFEVVDLVYDFTPQLQQIYSDDFNLACTICFEECVWTGDADNDSIVTGYDILQTSLAIGQEGLERNTPLILSLIHI